MSVYSNDGVYRRQAMVVVAKKTQTQNEENFKKNVLNG